MSTPGSGLFARPCRRGSLRLHSSWRRSAREGGREGGRAGGEGGTWTRSPGENDGGWISQLGKSKQGRREDDQAEGRHGRGKFSSLHPRRAPCCRPLCPRLGVCVVLSLTLCLPALTYLKAARPRARRRAEEACRTRMVCLLCVVSKEGEGVDGGVSVCHVGMPGWCIVGLLWASRTRGTRAHIEEEEEETNEEEAPHDDAILLHVCVRLARARGHMSLHTQLRGVLCECQAMTST